VSGEKEKKKNPKKNNTPKPKETLLFEIFQRD
jgi:hypothetical protein